MLNSLLQERSWAGEQGEGCFCWEEDEDSEPKTLAKDECPTLAVTLGEESPAIMAY